jgi:Uma2 family endonuclease
MGAMPQSAIPPAVDYPESDGQPMAETDLHRDEMFALIDMLRDHVGRGPDARDYVSGNLFVYYEPGNPAAVFAPDVFVVRGVGGRQRRIYKLWEERVAPEVVFEVSSRKTWLEDHGNKRILCSRLGVAEY